MQSDIRLHSIDDRVAEVLFSLANQRDVCRHFFGCSTLTEQRWRTWIQGRHIRSRLGLGSSYAISHSTFGPVGYCGLTTSGETSADLGYWVASDFRRHGFATSAIRMLRCLAFENSQLEVLIARCACNNLPSIRILMSLGFVERNVGLRGATQFECPRREGS